MDYFLNKHNVLDRLEREYFKHKKIIIAYDFDDTVYDFHNKGRSYDNVIALLKSFKNYAYFIVYTASEESRYPAIKKYLIDNDIPFDTINENIPSLNIPKGKKLYYNILLDDRAGLESAYNTLQSLLNTIERTY